MRCSILLLSLAIIYANASPIEDTVVPEESLYALDNDLDEATQTINDMTAAGKSDKDCRKLATDTRKDIQTNVDTCQNTLNAMPNGGDCQKRGQGFVQEMTEAKSKADKHVSHCHTEVTKAASASVDFGSTTFSSLTEGKCSSFYSSTSYTTAAASHKSAVMAFTNAKGAASEAATALKNAIAVAAKAKHKCLCEVRAAHEKAFSTQSAADAVNQKSWSFVCKLECVLDGKTTCKCSAAPKCKRAKLHTDVSAEAGKCDAVKAAAEAKKKAEAEATKKAEEEAKKKATEEAAKKAAAAKKKAEEAKKKAAEKAKKAEEAKKKAAEAKKKATAKKAAAAKKKAEEAKKKVAEKAKKAASYKSIGNGFCVNTHKKRPNGLNNAGGGWTWTKSSTVHADGSDPTCQAKCSKDSSCVGYMTEDKKTCGIMTGGFAIAGKDSEKRNYCFKKN